MKIFIPRNISGGRLKMSVSIGPLSLSIIQLMILAIGLWLTLALWNTLFKNGTSKGTAFIIALPVFLLCVFIAFFKYSELTLIPFCAKLVRTYFLDATKKFQVNRNKPDPKSVLLAKSRKTEHDVVITQKDLVMDEATLRRLRSIDEQE